MEDKERKEAFVKKLKAHPRKKANFLSHLLFCWQLPIFVKGWKKDLTEDDLYRPLEEYSSKRLGDKLEAAWSKEKPSLVRALVKVFGLEFALYGICYFPSDFVALTLQPYYLQKLLDYFTPHQKEVTRNQAYVYASILSVLFLFRLFFLHFAGMQLYILAIKVRVACCSLIYRNVLKMKKSSFGTITVGYLVNLLSNDVNRFEPSLVLLHYLWISPVDFVLILCYLDSTLGHTVLIGNLLLIISVIVEIFMIKKLARARRGVAAETDRRVRLMDDLINGVQIVKMYTWEKPFSELIKTVRKSELLHVATSVTLQFFNVVLRFYMSKICVVSSVIFLVAIGVPLTSQYLFSLVRISDIFRIILLSFFPMAVFQMVQLTVSVQRIEEFLLHLTLEEKYTPKVDEGVIRGIKLTNASVSWEKSSTALLTDIQFTASRGEVVAVTGVAGSGKSTLLQVILQEIELTKGCIKVAGSVSYASQEPWIFSGSVKQNILFGQDFDLEKYLEVIKVCALERDLTIFPSGDQTIVGERGVMLSGGQKARINLARALYRDADIYLLDDPLSAVDAHVAKEIFDKCILGYLRDKCVVLVTHQIQHLQKVTRIYLLESGKVITSDTCGKLRDLAVEKTRADANVVNRTSQNEVKEHRSAGNSDLQICKDYCAAAGHWSLTILTLSSFTILTLFGISVDYFVAFWVNVQQHQDRYSQKFRNFFTTNNFLYIYSALTVLLVLMSHLSSHRLVKYCVRVSKNLHSNMLQAFMQSTMAFFNHHLSGRILNRFTKDLGNVDEVLPTLIANAIMLFFSIVGTIIIIVVVNYWLIIPTVIVAGLVFVCNTLYKRTNRNIKRTEGITQSLIFTHLSASLQGLTTIKSSNAQGVLALEFDDHQDVHTSAAYLHVTTFAAYGFWIDFMCIVYCAIINFSCFLYGREETYVGHIGLIITQSSALIGMIQFAMKICIHLSTNLTSVERVLEYTALDSEVDDGSYVPPEPWPSSGTISFHTISLRYSPDDPFVLKRVSFEIEPGEKIGIVGRTGAGKTSLVSVLFRLFDFEGSVTIDGVDTKTVPLKTLRSKISIIPQEPVLFLGTLRKNLDPFDEFSDHQLWTALEELDLKKIIPSLETPVSEKGSNFSVGQRQLLCLVRSLLRNNKIVVLDEATASVDLKTDELIQTTVRKKFRNCTVLTIAHRLNTVVDSDKILVMEEGRVVEFGRPHRLLQNRSGFFYGYVKQSGEGVMEKFLRNARF